MEKESGVKFTLTCNAAVPVNGCRGTKTFDLPKEEAKKVCAAFQARKGVCAVCAAAGAVAREAVKSSRTVTQVRYYDPDEVITVTCWNRQCKHGVVEVPEFVRDGKVEREAYSYPVAAKVHVKRSEANGALCEYCKAEFEKENKA